MSSFLNLSLRKSAVLAGAAAIAATIAAPMAATVTAPASPSVIVEEAWVRGIMTEQTSTTVFMTLTSNVDAKLTTVRTPVAGKVELHTTTTEGGVSKMQAVPAIDLPARKAVELKPGGFHIMLLDVNRPIKPLELIPLSIVVETSARGRQTVHLEVPVRRVADGQMPERTPGTSMSVPK